jgi:hypothetical protein
MEVKRAQTESSLQQMYILSLRRQEETVEMLGYLFFRQMIASRVNLFNFLLPNGPNKYLSHFSTLSYF